MEFWVEFYKHYVLNKSDLIKIALYGFDLLQEASTPISFVSAMQITYYTIVVSHADYLLHNSRWHNSQRPWGQQYFLELPLTVKYTIPVLLEVKDTKAVTGK